MAFCAVHSSVRTKQWEAVLVILHLLRGDIPALNRVTLRAVRPKLAAMNVGVAIRTILARVRENWLYVKSFLVSSSMVCSENIDNRGSERFTPLVLIEMGNAGRLDKACLGVLSRGGA
jgi:hypothetical protein